MKNSIFVKTNDGIIISDVSKALLIAHDPKYYDVRYDLNPTALNDVYNYSSDNLTALYNFYLLGKLQGIKQGIFYEKNRKDTTIK